MPNEQSEKAPKQPPKKRIRSKALNKYTLLAVVTAPAISVISAVTTIVVALMALYQIYTVSLVSTVG